MSRNVVVPDFLLKAFNYWVFNEKDHWIFKVHRVVFVPIFVIGFSLLESGHLLQIIITEGDITQITEDLSHAVNHLLGLCKYTVMMSRGRLIQYVYENCIQNERAIYDKTKHFDRMKYIDESKIMNVKATSMLCVFASIFVAFGFSAPFLAESETFKGPDNVTMYTTRPLPFNTYVPFSEGLLPNYYFVFLYQGLSMTEVCFMILSFDNLFYGMLGQIAAQFKILGLAIQTIKQRSQEIVQNRLRLSSSELLTGRVHYEYEFRNEMERQLEKCITHHQFINETFVEVQKNFSLIMCLQFGTTLVVLCVGLFQCLVRSGLSFDFLYMISYALGITYQLFNYCWFGKEITSQSELIPTALMSAYWPAAPARYTSNLKFFLLRSHKPTVFNALGLFPLNLSTFGAVIRTAYSYFSVLKQTEYDIEM